MSEQKRLLIVGYVWPEPNSSAAGRHMLSLIECFKAHHWQVHFATPAEHSPHAISLKDRDVNTHAIELNSSSFDDFVSKLAPDAVLFDRFMIEEQFGWRVQRACPSALRILDTEDLHCLRDARHTALKQSRCMHDSDLHSDLAKREIAAIFRCDLTLVISEFEVQLLQRVFHVPKALLCHLPFLLDLSLYSQGPDFDDRQHIVSIGNFRHAPNWDAVRYLRESIWPQIRKQLPNVELHIYGAYPPPKAMALHKQEQGFLIKGWADDAYQVLRDARLCLAPLRFGAGIKGKLADAMLCGTPSITTPIGAESMHRALPWPGHIGQCPKELIDACVSLYTNPSQWEMARSNAWPILSSLYDKDTLRKRLMTHVQFCLSHLPNHRQQNFIGAMLNHHTMASTKYMSQWIEAKNKRQT